MFFGNVFMYNLTAVVKFRQLSWNYPQWLQIVCDILSQLLWTFMNLFYLILMTAINQTPLIMLSFHAWDWVNQEFILISASPSKDKIKIRELTLYYPLSMFHSTSQTTKLIDTLMPGKKTISGVSWNQSAQTEGKGREFV